MKKNLRLIFSIFWIVLGSFSVVFSRLHPLDDFWFSFGFSLALVGVFQLIRCLRYRADAAYREKTDTAEQDERNRFLRDRAWAWSGYGFCLLAGVAVIVLNIVGLSVYANLLAFCICTVIVLYVISFWALNKKY